MPNENICKFTSNKELMTVFKLCDPMGMGRVKIEYFRQLALTYAKCDKKVKNIYYRLF